MNLRIAISLILMLSTFLVACDEEMEYPIGSTVAVAGNQVIVGAKGRDLGSSPAYGAVFVFEDVGGTWMPVQTLTPSVSLYGGQFGYSLAVKGDYMVISAPFNSSGGFSNNGTVYLFKRNSGGSWSEIAQIHAPVPQNNGRFGYSVDISDGLILVGAPYFVNQSGIQAGVIFVLSYDSLGNNALEFRQEGWLLHQSFGQTVAIDGTRFVVSSPGIQGADGIQKGFAHMYEHTARSGFQVHKEFESPQQSGLQSFGSSLALVGDKLGIGDSYGDCQEIWINCGVVHAYRRDSATDLWNLEQTIYPSFGGQDNDGFGQAIASDGVNLIVGAPFDTVKLKTGSAYTYWIF